jgi:hypothetical protein
MLKLQKYEIINRTIYYVYISIIKTVSFYFRITPQDFLKILSCLNSNCKLLDWTQGDRRTNHN